MHHNNPKLHFSFFRWIFKMTHLETVELSLNYRWYLRRNLSVVLSLNDFNNNIIINYLMCFLTNGKYKDLSIVNNKLFFKDNTSYVSFSSKLNFFKEFYIFVSKERSYSGIVKLTLTKVFIQPT